MGIYDGLKKGEWDLFTAQDADGDSAVVEFPGGDGVFAAYGTFGAGTCKLKWSPDAGTTYIDVGFSTELTAAGQGAFNLPPCKLRANFAGSTGASLNAKLFYMG